MFLSKRYVQLDKTKNGMARKVPLDDFALQLWTLALKLTGKEAQKYLLCQTLHVMHCLEKHEKSWIGKC